MIGLNLTRTDVPWPAEATHVRLWDAGVHWGAIHVQPDVYDWSRLDQLVERAAGRHITYVVCGTPRWLAADPNSTHAAPWLGPGSNSLPRDIDEFNKFIWNLGTRYKGRIHAYEIWNEPQLRDFLEPYTISSCSRLAKMTLRAANTLEKVDSSAVVVTASVLPRASSGGMTRARRWLEALERTGWPGDVMSCHIYPEPNLGVQRWKAMLQDVVSTLTAMQCPRKRLWVTETTFGLLGDPIGPADAAKLVSGVYGTGKRIIFWYAWDRPDLGGLYIADGSAAWQAIKEEHNG